MYYYKIAHATHDGGNEIILAHAEKWTKEEITHMVGDAIIGLLKSLEKERGTYKFPRSVEYIDEDITAWLVKNRGFTKPEFEVVWATDSFASLFDLKDHRHGFPDEDLDPITRRLNKLGYSGKDDWMMVRHEND